MKRILISLVGFLHRYTTKIVTGGADDAKTISQSYYLVFSSFHGQHVLQHLLDTVYFPGYDGTDENGALIHNAQRGVVHNILLNISAGGNPRIFDTPSTDRATEEAPPYANR